MGIARRTERPLIVTGSSAGGIEALSVLLSGLPSTFAAPIVIAQHLDPRVPSSLAAILANHTALRVVALTGRCDLEAGTAYVVPADRHVEINGDSVYVHDGDPGRPKPSIDLLFASAAAAFGEGAIAVILTGLGSDGSSGARAIKLAGGRMVIEDPMTASFPSMPASLEPAMVDVIAPLRDLAGELQRLVAEATELAQERPELTELIEHVRARSGIDFASYKPATIRRRLARQMQLAGHKTIADYLTYVVNDPAEFGRLVSNFLIKVTEFFRDPELFEQLRLTAIPNIIAEAHQRGNRELRLWSAGCATGEEAYSLAILVAEAIGDETDLANVRIFATDIDEAAIAFARRGIYPGEAVKSLDSKLVGRYFTETGNGWEVVKHIRNMTVFGQHDLGQRAPFPRIDLALCRNVLIYFSKELQARTLAVFAFSIRNGGYLALGKSETTSPLGDYFSPIDPVLRLFRRHGDRVTIPAAQPHKHGHARHDVDRLRGPFPAFERDLRDPRLSLAETLGEFLIGSSLGVVLVDRHYDISTINASAREMLNIHGVAIGEDLVHLAPADIASELRALLDGALRNVQPGNAGQEVAIGVEGGERSQHLALFCYPVPGEDGKSINGALLLAVDVSENSRGRREAERMTIEQAREIKQLRRYEAYARDRLRSLVDANKELASVNFDLRAHNDALVISAEQAEAATEEIETLNEEMQATNEELETLNEEFQATIEELNTTNDELEARRHELTEQLRERDLARLAAEGNAAAFVAITDRLPFAIAAVDVTGMVLVSNERFRSIQQHAIESAVVIDDDAGATIS